MSPRTRKDIPNPKRCTWAEGDPLMEKYHDEEWGFPVRTTRKHFEQLTLEIFQAGLSWRTILHKRAEFRKEFLRDSHPRRSPSSPRRISGAFSGTPASCGTERKSRRPSRTPKDSWPSRKNMARSTAISHPCRTIYHRYKRYSARNSPSWDPRSQKPISKAWGRYPNSTIRAAGGIKKIDNYLYINKLHICY